MNTIKDLLRDLAMDLLKDLKPRDRHLSTSKQRSNTIIAEELVDEYHDRFIKENSKYFELEDK